MPRCSYLPTVCISNYQYNLGVKSQGQIKTKSVIRLIFISTTEGVHIWYNDCHVCRLQHMFLITALPLVSKDKSKYTYNQFMAYYANFSFIFYQWFSYLAQLLLMVCKLQSTLHIIAMTLESKVIRICLTVVCF